MGYPRRTILYSCGANSKRLIFRVYGPIITLFLCYCSQQTAAATTRLLLQSSLYSPRTTVLPAAILQYSLGIDPQLHLGVVLGEADGHIEAAMLAPATARNKRALRHLDRADLQEEGVTVRLRY